MGKGDGCCGANPPREVYAMDWRENSHDMDELVVKIMQEGKSAKSAVIVIRETTKHTSLCDDQFLTQHKLERICAKIK